MDTQSIRRRLEHEEINALPLCQYKGEIRLVRSQDDWEDALETLEAAHVLGFDTETRPTFRKGKSHPPALIQLAAESVVYIVQLRMLPFSSRHAAILANPGIIKAGVGIGDDMAALARCHDFAPSGHVDLGKVATLNGLPNHGLRTLAASLFGWRISKGPQCSNWNLQQLSARQIQYAATDAWISREIFIRMRELGLRGTGLPETA